MKKRLVVWVFYIISSLALSIEPSFAPGLMAQPGPGAASIAKGGVSLGEGDPLWALWNDPSGLIGAGIGSGKTIIVQALEQKLWAASKQTILLDGDQVSHGLCGDLGFSPENRTENIRGVGHLAKLFYEHGNIVLCSLVSPYAKDRDAVKALFSEADFVELYVQSSIETRQKRDPKGLYAKAKSGEITGIHGYDLAFEELSSPDFVLNTDENNP